MSIAERIVAEIEPARLPLVLGAMEQGALFYRDGDDVYAAVREDWGWWVYRLEHGAPEYAVSMGYDRCTCPSFYESGPCKHIRMLKHGGDHMANVPWNPPRRRKKKFRGPR